MLQPVLVRPRPGGTFELSPASAAGARPSSPASTTLPAIVRERDDAESLELALIENMAREDLNPVEEARACAALVEELGLTREDVGRRVGRSRVASRTSCASSTCPTRRSSCSNQVRLTEGHGRALLLAEDHADRRRLAREAADDGLVGPRGRGPGPRRERARRQAGAPPARRAGPPRPGGGDGRRWPRPTASCLGRDVAVRPRGAGYRIEVDFASLEDALKLAERLDGTPRKAR